MSGTLIEEASFLPRFCAAGRHEREHRSDRREQKQGRHQCELGRSSRVVADGAAAPRAASPCLPLGDPLKLPHEIGRASAGGPRGPSRGIACDDVEHGGAAGWVFESGWGSCERSRRSGAPALALERLPARDHLVEDGAEREDVGARVGLLPFELLGRHVLHVPMIVPGAVGARRGDRAASATGRDGCGRAARASPGRSRAASRRPCVSMMLPGFRSRWTMPCAVRLVERVGDLRSPTSAPRRAAARPPSRAASVSPSRYSMTRKSIRPAGRRRTACRCADG